MKYLKEYSQHVTYLPNQFTPEDIEELQDVYQDIVDELGLYDNPFKVLQVDDSSFQLPKKYEGKMCKIFIRTIVSEISVQQSIGWFKDVTAEEMEKHNQMLKEVQPHIERIKRMGYKVECKNLETGNYSNMNVNGIIIEITK